MRRPLGWLLASVAMLASAATRRFYSDHGGDVVVYAVFVPLGGVVGLLAGGIIGAALGH